MHPNQKGDVCSEGRGTYVPTSAARIVGLLALFLLAAIPFSLYAATPTFQPVNPLQFTKPFAGADPLPQILAIASTGTNFDFTSSATTSGGGNWLTVSAPGFNCCATPRAIVVTVSAAASLAVGTYSGQIVFTNFPSKSTQITVPVTLTVAPPGGTFFDNVPGQMSFSLITGGGTPPSQSIQIRNGGAGTLNWTLTASTSDGGNWLTTPAVSGTAPSTVSVGLLTQNLPGGGLIAGTYTGQLLFQTTGSTVTVPVSVVVGANVFQQANAISFTKPFAGADPLPQTLAIASTGTNFDFTSSATTAGGGNWLQVSAPGFNCCATPRAIVVTVSAAASLAVGTYTGQVVFTGPNGNMAMTVPVTLTVASPGGTFFDSVPGQMSFSLITGGGTPPSQSIQIRNGGVGTLNWTLTASTSDGGNWLSEPTVTGTAPSTVSVRLLTQNLPGGGLIAGTYTGQLLFQTTGSSVTVPVSVVVGASVFSQVNAISFAMPFAGANPLPQTLAIASTGTNFDFTSSATTAGGGNWLQVSAPGFNCCATPRAIVVTVSAAASLAVGTYTGQVVFTGPNGNMAMTVPVTLTVAPPGGTFFDNVQGQMSFSFQAGSSNPTAQAVQIRNGGSGTLNWTLAASTADGGNWLSASALSGTAPSTATIGILTAALPSGGLVAGTYTGQLLFQAPGSSVTVPVSVVIGASVFVQLDALSFTKPFAGANPLPQTLTIASTGANFDFSLSGAGSWLQVSAPGSNCCATPRAITVSVNAAASLAAGTYTGQAVFTGPNGNMAMTVPVILTVTGSFTLSSGSATAPAGGGANTVGVTSGSQSAQWTAVSNVAWITITSGASGTGSGTVNYSVAPTDSLSQRTGTMTIAGLTFTVTQDGAVLTLNSNSASVGSTGTAASVTVTSTSSGAAWTAVSNASWITITSGAGGTGNGSAGYLVAANTAQTQRVGTLTIAGQTFTITQAGTGGVTAGLYFYPVAPCRVADTRGNGKSGAYGPPALSANSTRAFSIPNSGCGVPSTAAAFSLNITVVPTGQLIYLTLWPTGVVQPTASTLNDFSTQSFLAGNVQANAAIVPAGSNGSVSVFVSDTSDLIIDVNGYFAPPGTGGLAFYPVAPCRVVDTRGNGRTGTFGPPVMAANSNRSFAIPQSGCGAPTTAQAYSLNMTVVPTAQLTYLTTWPTGQVQPNASTLNDFSVQNLTLDLGRVVANAAIVPAGDNGAVSVFVSDASDLIVDINGYFAPPGGSGALSFYTTSPCRLVDTRGNGLTGAFGTPTMGANTVRNFPIPQSSCGVTSAAQAYSLNMTVVPPQQLIYLTTWPTGQVQPGVSTLNDFSTRTPTLGWVVANAAIVPAGTGGSVSVFVSDTSDVIVDINGYFAP